jgi:hypothetical protein
MEMAFDHNVPFSFTEISGIHALRELQIVGQYVGVSVFKKGAAR